LSGQTLAVVETFRTPFSVFHFAMATTRISIIALAMLAAFGPAASLHKTERSQVLRGQANARQPTDATSAAAQSVQEMHNDGDASYTITVSLGGQNLEIIPDTGSFDFLVFGTHCKMGCGPVHRLYNDSLSSTYEKGSAYTLHQFGSGDAWSSESYDTVTSGPAKSEHQVFWEVYDADMPILESGDFQGILGLGPPESSVMIALRDASDVQQEVNYIKSAGGKVSPRQKKIANNYFTLADHAKAARSVAADFGLKSYSICLRRSSGSPGSLIWHDMAPEQRPANMFRTIQSKEGDLFWSAKLEHVELGPLPSALEGQSRTQIGCGQGEGSCTAIVDSGTSLIVAPRDAAWKVEDALRKWRALSGNCTDLSTLPNLEFTMGGMPFVLPPQSYVGDLSGDWSELDPKLQGFLPHLDAQIMKLRTERDSDSQPYDSCVPLIMIMDSAPGEDQQWILGMPFFRQYYTTFTLAQGETEWRRKAASMSFALADSECRPTMDKLLQQRNLDDQQRMRIDVSKIRVPHRVTRKKPEISTE